MFESRWLWRGIAALLIAASGAAHIAYLTGSHALDLAPDEAHYWQWSQNLDASYYSKGPLVAYLIRASSEVVHALLSDQAQSGVLAVRLPAVLCGSLLLVAVYLLTLQCFGRERLAALAVAATLAFPVFTISRTIMTIDAPYACCWAWALVLGHRAIFRGSPWAWPLLGLVLGLGMLAKYTMVLWLPSALLFLAARKELRPLLRRAGPWLAVAIACLCCAPIVWWNWKHGWVSIRHVGGQAGVTAGARGIRWLGPAMYVGGQAGLLLGAWFALWAAAVVARRPGRDDDPHRAYLWFLSVPQFVFFGAFSFATDILPNWPITAYISGLVLAGEWAVERLGDFSVVRQRAAATLAACAFSIGVFGSVLVHDTTRLRPWLARLAGEPRFATDIPVRRLDPTCRLRGWRFLAREVDGTMANLRDAGINPILAASRWTTASELVFYCQGHPRAYSLGSALWDRQSQFDLWRPNPVHDPDEFLGRDFVFVDVGDLPTQVLQAFDRVEPTRRVWYKEGDVPIAFWDITICRGFRGFATLANRKY